MRGAAILSAKLQMDFNKFLLTRLMRGAALYENGKNPCAAFLLTRLMRGAAVANLIKLELPIISTHAPHARRGGVSS